MVNSLNGISAAEYQAYLKVQNQIVNEGVTTPTLTYANDSTQFSTSGCTDGKDDGKIGVFSAIGNTIKGVGKTIVNGVKGMFTTTDENGNTKFSLGKTLLSVGTAAACVAFPAVGLAACVVGGTMGAIQVGKGVIKAATAETDAEAKQAWQDIGGGAFTVGASVVGAKAGYNAVKNTAGGATSALGQLDDAATIGQKAVALGKDMITSTKNQASKIRTAATPYAEAAKIKYTEAKASKITKNSGALTSDELHAVNNAKYQRMFASDDTLAALDKMDDITNIAKTNYNNVKSTAQEAIKHPIKAGKQAVSAGRSAWNKAKGYVTKENAENLWNGIQEAYDNNVKGNSISMLAKNLQGTAKNIWTDLSTGKYSYPEVVNKYGYKSVAEVIQYMGGTIYGTSTI